MSSKWTKQLPNPARRSWKSAASEPYYKNASTKPGSSPGFGLFQLHSIDIPPRVEAAQQDFPVGRKAVAKTAPTVIAHWNRQHFFQAPVVHPHAPQFRVIKSIEVNPFAVQGPERVVHIVAEKRPPSGLRHVPNRHPF